MATSKLSELSSWCPSQLKIVLLGGRNSGKSVLGNLLLGREEFITKERTTCSRRLGLVGGRWLTVVDTPGWWCDFSSQDTCELVKRELVGSVSLCPPGPHVFLLVVKASSAFSEKRRRAVEEHVGLLGDSKVWDHCLLVFTHAHISERIEAAGQGEWEVEGAGLHWLRDKCGHRCHNVFLSGDSDVTELLLKIQTLVNENAHRVFEVKESVLRKIAEERSRVQEDAQQRFMKMKRHRSIMQESLRPVTDIRLVLVGAKGSGKTSALHTILGRDSVPPTGRTAECAVGSAVVFGRRVTAVDTPGWWMNYFREESSAFDLRELQRGPSLCPPGPQVFLLVVRVDRAFRETYRRAAEEHLQLLGRRVWARVILLFTFGDWLGGTTTERYIESEGGALRWLVDRCHNRYHVLNNKTKGDGFQVRELIGKIEETAAGCCGGCCHPDREGEAEAEAEAEAQRLEAERLEAAMRSEAERAEERARMKERQRQMARLQLEGLEPLTDVRILLVGGSRTGKSSCGNTILGEECFDASSPTACCAERRGTVGDTAVTVLDTPGGFPLTPALLAPPCAVLLVVNASSSFTEARGEALERQVEAAAAAAAGGGAWRRAMVLFSCGDWLGDSSVERRVESEGAALRRLLHRCGNRYHVFDNQRRGGGAQVMQLMELIEEMLVEERLRPLGHVDTSLSSRVKMRKEDLKALMSRRHHLYHDLSEAAAPPAGEAGERAELAVAPFSSAALPAAERSRGQRRLTLNLPFWLPTESGFGPSRERQLLSGAHQSVVLVFPHALMEESGGGGGGGGGGGSGVRALCLPALRERTLRRLGDSGDLQALIDRWGDSSLEELEAFIDLYFEAVWEQAMGSSPPPPHAEQQEEATAAVAEEALVSIDRKLSKLELLEEIKGDLSELRRSLEHGWRLIQGLRDQTGNQ